MPLEIDAFCRPDKRGLDKILRAFPRLTSWLSRLGGMLLLAELSLMIAFSLGSRLG